MADSPVQDVRTQPTPVFIHGTNANKLSRNFLVKEGDILDMIGIP